MHDQSSSKLTVREWIAQEQGKHFCQCGCGKPIPIKKWHHSAGIPGFLRGHMPLERRANHNPSKYEVRLCECGCGEQVSGVHSGRLIRFKKGHWARLHQPMKNPETAAKLARKLSLPLGSKHQAESRAGLVYIEIKCPDGRWRYEHRWIMQEHLGRELRSDEHVHHLNHDTLDNRLENLELISHSEHSKLHCAFTNVAKREEKRR